MKTNHTPGPWKVMYATKNGESALAVWPAQTVEGNIGSPVCKISPESSENETDRANARLIAAAPELLEIALESQQALMNLFPESKAKKCFDSGHSPCECTLCKLNRVIAKAKGEKEQVA